MTPAKRDTQHERRHYSLLAAREKQLLVWIARRLPHRVGPDHLSLLGLTAMAAAGIAFWASSFHPSWLLVVVAALALNWFGDSLDGTVARVRSQQRPRYGFYVDHVFDVAGAAFLFGGMALSSHMSTIVGLALLAAYLMVSAESYLATHARSVFRLSFMRVGPTELRLLLALGVARLLVDPTVTLYGRKLLLFDVGGVVATVGLLLAFTVSTLRNAASLYREEPLPQPAPACPARSVTRIGDPDRGCGSRRRP